LKEINQDWSKSYEDLNKHYRKSQQQLEELLAEYNKINEELKRLKSPQMLDKITKEFRRFHEEENQKRIASYVSTDTQTIETNFYFVENKFYQKWN